MVSIVAIVGAGASVTGDSVRVTGVSGASGATVVVVAAAAAARPAVRAAEDFVVVVRGARVFGAGVSAEASAAGSATGAALGVRVPVLVVRLVRAGVARVVEPAAAAAVFAPAAGRFAALRAGAFEGAPSSSPGLAAIVSPVCCAVASAVERVVRGFAAGRRADCFTVFPDCVTSSLAAAPAVSSDSGLSDDVRSELTPLTYQAVRELGHPPGDLAKSEPRKLL
ncbi:hypothetical protein [Leifsonia sp. NPDC058248]|uniref:hypothetical protein n=1 Tax=Leifsonia sp. NPDC058248 TaxID=3346402 RepID=UPI0036DDC865